MPTPARRAAAPACARYCRGESSKGARTPGRTTTVARVSLRPSGPSNWLDSRDNRASRGGVFGRRRPWTDINIGRVRKQGEQCEQVVPTQRHASRRRSPPRLIVVAGEVEEDRASPPIPFCRRRAVALLLAFRRDDTSSTDHTGEHVAGDLEKGGGVSAGGPDDHRGVSRHDTRVHSRRASSRLPPQW